MKKKKKRKSYDFDKGVSVCMWPRILLLKTQKTIDWEIVFESGFSNKVTFFKVFRERKYGCTPKEFRMKNLEEVRSRPDDNMSPVLVGKEG